MITRKHLAAYDIHAPKNIKLTGLCDYAKDYKPTDFINGGDFANLEWASHWNTDYFNNIGWDNVNRFFSLEMERAREVLAEIDRSLPKSCKKYFIPGNHEYWLLLCAKKYPGKLDGIRLDFNVRTLNFNTDMARKMNRALTTLLNSVLHLDKFGYHVLPYNEELRLNQLSYIHGHEFSTVAAMKKHYPSRSVIGGHHHTHSHSDGFNSGNVKRPCKYIQVPCLTHLMPGYLKSKSTCWSNGFFTANILSNGYFDDRVVNIIDGQVHNG